MIFKKLYSSFHYDTCKKVKFGAEWNYMCIVNVLVEGILNVKGIF